MSICLFSIPTCSLRRSFRSSFGRRNRGVRHASSSHRSSVADNRAGNCEPTSPPTFVSLFHQLLLLLLLHNTQQIFSRPTPTLDLLVLIFFSLLEISLTPNIFQSDGRGKCITHTRRAWPRRTVPSCCCCLRGCVTQLHNDIQYCNTLRLHQQWFLVTPTSTSSSSSSWSRRRRRHRRLNVLQSFCFAEYTKPNILFTTVEEEE